VGIPARRWQLMLMHIPAGAIVAMFGQFREFAAFGGVMKARSICAIHPINNDRLFHEASEIDDNSHRRARVLGISTGLGLDQSERWRKPPFEKFHSHRLSDRCKNAKYTKVNGGCLDVSSL
jgi:hypothetical protein